MAKLTAKARKAIPKRNFAVPSKAPGSGSYPINDPAHARAALSRASGKPVEARVRAAVKSKYPQIMQDRSTKGSPPMRAGELAQGYRKIGGDWRSPA